MVLARSRRRTTLLALGSRMRSASGFGLISYVTAVAVVLVATGTLATVAMAGQQNVKDLVAVELCRQVETAECAYEQQQGAPTADLSKLVSAGFLSGLPRSSQAAQIAVRLTDQGGFQVLSGGRVVLTRRL